MKTRILLADRQRACTIDSDKLSAAAQVIAAEVWDGPVEISITLLGKRAMAAANRDHRGVLGATDQISFPLASDAPSHDGVTLVGDLLLCPAVIVDQCGSPPPDGRPDTGTPDLELALVLIHGLLHLGGYTHGSPADAEAMIARERALFSAHGSLLEATLLRD